MKIICRRDSLFKMITISLRAISTKITIPILECCLIKAEDGFLVLTSYDMEIAVKTSKIEADVKEPGLIAVDGKMLFDIVKNAPSDEIDIEVKANNIVHIKSGKSEFKILGQAAEEFPDLPEINIITKETPHKIPAVQLKNMIRNTIFSVSKNTAKPQLCGGLFEFKENTFKIITIDGFRISYRNFPFMVDGEIKAIVPEKTMAEISKILPSEEDSFVDIYISNKHILFEMPDCIMISSLLEGEFINYENMFAKEATTKVKINRNNFINSIERSMVISKDAKKNSLKLDIADSKIIFSSNADIGSSYEEMDVEQDGENLEISFNPRYLLDALKSIESEVVLLDLTLTLSPCIIKAENSQEYNYLVLPVRVR